MLLLIQDSTVTLFRFNRSIYVYMFLNEPNMIPIFHLSILSNIAFHKNNSLIALELTVVAIQIAAVGTTNMPDIQEAYYLGAAR